MKLNAYTEYLRSLCVSGLLCGTLFFSASLLPSLVPREPHIQGLLSGLCFSLGYAVGHVLEGLRRALQLPMLTGQRLKYVQFMTIVACVLLAIAALWQASDWQNRQRALMAMPPVDSVRPWLVAILSAFVFGLILLVLRLFKAVRIAISQRLQIYLPSTTA